MAIGLGAELGKSDLLLDVYKDQQENIYPNISRIPFIILQGKSGEIRKLVMTVREKGIAHGIFLNTMTGGGYEQQLARTAQAPESDLIYYGCCLFGTSEELRSLTKKFSLWKDRLVV